MPTITVTYYKIRNNHKTWDQVDLKLCCALVTPVWVLPCTLGLRPRGRSKSPCGLAQYVHQVCSSEEFILRTARIQILSLHLLSVLLHLDVEGWPVHRTPQTLPKQSSVQEKLSSYHWTSPCICTEWPASGYCHLWESMSPSVTGSFAPSNVFPLLRSPKSALFLTQHEREVLY